MANDRPEPDKRAKRTELFSIDFTRDEFMRMIADAGESGLTPEEYMRAKLGWPPKKNSRARENKPPLSR